MIEKKYLFLYFAILFGVIITPFFIPYGGIVADTLSYIKIANDIPNIKSGLFPLGYPSLLRFFYIFTNDFYFSGRIISVLIIAFIGVFSYFKKFYFKETVILLATKIFIVCVYNLISEGLFLCVLYFLFYYINCLFTDKKKGFAFVLPVSLLLVTLFLIRYSGIFIYLSVIIFFLLNFRKTEFVNFKKDILSTIILSGVLISIYMIFNYFNFGGIMGENERFAVDKSNISLDIIRNFLGVINLANPIFGIKPAHFTSITIVLEAVLFILNLIFIGLIFNILKKEKPWKSNLTIVFLLISSVTYLVFVILSKFFQGIEELNTRMLSATSFCLYFAVLIIYFKSNFNKKYIFYLAVFSLVFNVIYTVKEPKNFLERKAEVEKQIEKLKGKKYYFDDHKNVENSRSEYHIPIINKTFFYEHNNQQKSFIDGNIIMAKKPEISLLLKDTVQNKKTIIFSSDIK